MAPPLPAVLPTLVLKDVRPVVAAVKKKKTTLLFRRGGTREAGGGFEIKRRAFWLLPTQYHSTKARLVREESDKGLTDGVPAFGKGLSDVIETTTLCYVKAAYSVPDAEAALEASIEHHPFDPKAFAAARFRRKEGTPTPATVLELRTVDVDPPIRWTADDDTWGCFSYINAPRQAVDATLLDDDDLIANVLEGEPSALIEEALLGVKALPMDLSTLTL